ncbi:hypothetical protein IC582_004853 [Cucumis melo]
MFEKFKQLMMFEFDLSDLGKMHYFLGLEVVQSPFGIFISQRKYVQNVLMRFQMSECNSVSTLTEFGLKLHKDQEGKKVDSTLYKQIVGSLMYITTTRPDIKYIHGESNRDASFCCQKNFSVLARNKRLWIVLQECGEVRFCWVYYYEGDIDDRKSTLGYVVMLCSGAVSWSSEKQSIVTLLTIEAEFIAATSCACQAIWLKKILEEL